MISFLAYKAYRSEAPEEIESANDLIQFDRRVTVDDIARTLSLSLGTAHKIVHDDLGYSKVSCRRVPKMLTPEQKQRRVKLSQQFLCRYEKNGDEFLKKVVTCDENGFGTMSLSPNGCP